MLLLAVIIGIAVGIGTGVFLSGNNDLLFVSALFGLAGGVAGCIIVSLLYEGDDVAPVNIPVLVGIVVGALSTALLLNGLHKLVDRHRHDSRPGDKL